MDESKGKNNTALPDEEALVEKAKQGDSQALSTLYETYFDRIYRYIFLRMRNESEAEDLTQQVFMKMLKSISGFKSKGVPFSAWLYRIAHNQVVDFHRQQNRKSTVDIEGLPLQSTAEDPQQAIELEVDIDELKKAVSKLTAAQQEVLALRFTGELPIARCAEIMGKSDGAIKALQHSAVVALRKTLTVS